MSVWPYNSSVGTENIPRCKGHTSGGSGEWVPFILVLLFQIDHGGGWGLKANWCPEIKILIDLLRQDALYCQEASHSQGQPQSAPQVSEDSARQPSLPARIPKRTSLS